MYMYYQFSFELLCTCSVYLSSRSICGLMVAFQLLNLKPHWIKKCVCVIFTQPMDGQWYVFPCVSTHTLVTMGPYTGTILPYKCSGTGWTPHHRPWYRTAGRTYISGLCVNFFLNVFSEEAYFFHKIGLYYSMGEEEDENKPARIWIFFTSQLMKSINVLACRGQNVTGNELIQWATMYLKLGSKQIGSRPVSLLPGACLHLHTDLFLIWGECRKHWRFSVSAYKNSAMCTRS